MRKYGFVAWHSGRISYGWELFGKEKIGGQRKLHQYNFCEGLQRPRTEKYAMIQESYTTCRL